VSKPDHKLLSFLACYKIERHKIADLSHLFSYFTPDEKQDIAIIRSCINSFYSIMKYINTYSILNELLLNLPRIKPK